MLRRLFGLGPSISPQTRAEVLRYLADLWRLRALQDDEAGHYNDALVKHGATLAAGSESAKVIAEAARKMDAVNQDLVNQHTALGPIPAEAGQCYFAWHTSWLALAEWSSAAAAAYEALATGNFPVVERVTHLLTNEQRVRKQAEAAEAKLMKSLRLTAEEARMLMRQGERGDGS